MNKIRKGKKVIILKKSIIAIISLLLCMMFVFAGCNKTPVGSLEEGSVVVPEEYVQSDVKIQEGESTVETNLGKGVEMFISNKYYLDGTIYYDGTAVPVKMSTDGAKNMQLTVDISGINLGILVLDNKNYVIIPDSKEYTELSDTLVSALGLDSTVSVSEFQQIQNEDNNQTATITQSKVSINGEPGLCTTHIYDETTIKLYSIGDKLVQVENYDQQGNITMQIVVNSITSQIPSDQLSLKGLTKVGVTAFIKTFTAAAMAAVNQQ